MSDLVVRRCRMCGRRFEQSAKAYPDHVILYATCKHCLTRLAERTRRADPRYLTVGGHAWQDNFNQTNNKEKKQ